VLAKTITELLIERPYGKDEIYKYLGSTALLPHPASNSTATIQLARTRV